MRGKFHILLFSTILFLFFHNFSSIAKPPQTKQSQKTLEHEVKVTLKLIQVSVTDSQGNPVTDLTKSDFILYDNGELKKITDFETHFLLTDPAATDNAAPPAPVSSLMPRKFFLLLDYFQNDLLGINKSKEVALNFIENQVTQGDEVAVLSYNMEKGLVLHEFLSTDYRKVMDTVKGIRGPPAWVQKDGRESTEEEKRWMRFRSRQYVTELKELAKSLRHIPGYKNLIIFSGGLPRKYLYGKWEEYGEQEQELKDVGFIKITPGLNKIYEDMSRELSASNSKVFTVNTYNARAMLNDPPEDRGDHSLQIISEMSGGKYFSEVEYKEQIAQDIQRTTGNYYVLGYYISEHWDGRYHKLKVDVRRKGARVLSQRGYYDPKPFADFTEFEKKLHLTSLALNEKSYFEPPQSFSLLSLHYGYQKENQSLLLAEIPRNELGEIIQGKTEIVNLILGEGNEIIVSERCEMNFSVFDEPTVYLYSIRSLKPGRYRCRMVIRNLKTGKAAVGSAEAVIPDRPESGLIIDPPLLVIPREKAAFVRLSEELNETESRDQTSLKSYYPYLTNEQTPIVQYLEKGTEKIYAILRGSVAGIEEPDIDLAVYLISDNLESKILLNSIVLSSQEEGENTDILFIEIELPDLSEGQYSLEFRAEELTSGSVSESSSKIQIR